MDCITVPIVIILAYSLKFKVGWIFQRIFFINYGQIYDHAQVEPYLAFSGIIIVLWIITFYFVGLYHSFTGLMPEVDELIKIIKGVTIVVFELSLVNFFFKLLPDSRYFLLYLWGAGIIVFFCIRLVIARIEVGFLKRGIGTKRLLVIGSDAIAQDIIEQVLLYPSLGFSYSGTVCEQKEPDVLHYHLRKKFNFLGGYSSLYNIVEKHHIKVIFVSEEGIQSCDSDTLIQYCHLHNIELNIISKDHQYYSQYTSVLEYDGIPFLNFKKSLNILKKGVYKRIFDFLFSIILFFLCLPLFIIIGIAIKLVSPSGPVFYVQTRLTQGSKVFEMIKFRTMIPNAEKDTGAVMVSEKNEIRYHAIGSFLRKSSLDELPQLVNIIKGEMSVVGPRPERPEFVEDFKKDIPNFDQRHLVKAGLTGWAQVNGRSVLTRRPAHKLKYDLNYIKYWSFIWDIKIILKTVQIVLSKEEAF